MAHVRSLCEACHLGAIPVGVNERLFQFHNRHHPLQSAPGEVSRLLWLERLVPDGEESLLFLYIEAYKLSFGNDFRRQPHVYQLRNGSLKTVEDGVERFNEAEAKVPAEMQLLCTLSAG